MGRKSLKTEDVGDLTANKYVLDVDRGRIFYTPEFKKHFISEYNKGKKPSEIFRDAGFDPDVLGNKRIERACSRWRVVYNEKGLDAFDKDRIPLSKENLSRQQEIARLKDLVVSLYEENLQLKKELEIQKEVLAL